MHSEPGLLSSLKYIQAEPHCKTHGGRFFPTKNLLENHGCFGCYVDSPTKQRPTKQGSLLLCWQSTWEIAHNLTVPGIPIKLSHVLTSSAELDPNCISWLWPLHRSQTPSWKHLPQRARRTSKTLTGACWGGLGWYQAHRVALGSNRPKGYFWCDVSPVL